MCSLFFYFIFDVSLDDVCEIGIGCKVQCFGVFGFEGIGLGIDDVFDGFVFFLFDQLYYFFVGDLFQGFDYVFDGYVQVVDGEEVGQVQVSVIDFMVVDQVGDGLVW